MTAIVLAALFILGAIFGPRFIPSGKPLSGITRAGLRAVFALVAAFLLASTSYIYVPADGVGHVRQIYGTETLQDGRSIAAHGENGYQARVLAPGFHFRPLLRVLNDIEILPMVTVPTGHYGRVVAADGEPLRTGQIMADAWPDAQFQNFLDAEYFMTHGGQRGLQASVLPPGRYALNLYLFEVRIGFTNNVDHLYNAQGFHQIESPLLTAITSVPAGHVGVVRSTISRPGIDCTPTQANTAEGALTVELVPRGCAGIWTAALPPGDYFLNRDAYDVTLVDTRVQTWEFKGGFAKRFIDLNVDQQGNITQSQRSQQEAFDPQVHADRAVFVKIEGWDVPQELRVLVQITPENAPIVVASVGGLRQVETNILVPVIRSAVRNVTGGVIAIAERDAEGNRVPVTRPTRVLDLINNRDALEQAVLAAVRPDGLRAGVNIMEVRFGEPAIPPELLVARQREQLAQQLARAYEEERKAQVQRQASEQARATADQQPELVRAQISVQVAQQTEIQRAAQGRAERNFLEQLAEGQRAQTTVLGEDRVFQLNIIREVLQALQARPELLTGLRLPQVFVSSSGAGLEGPAAVLGNALRTAAPPPSPAPAPPAAPPPSAAAR